MAQVLVVDDNKAVLEAFQILFELHDVPCKTAGGVAEALAEARGGEVGLVIQDMNFTPGRTSGEEGIELFRGLRAIDPGLPILLITAWTSLEVAVQLVKEGATDYLAKPWDDAKLVDNVKRLLKARAALAAPAAPPAPRPAGLIYRSAAMERLVRLATSVAPSSVPVLVTGPNGAGKEKLADLLHAAGRARGPLIKVNLGALPVELAEAELFGAEAGAFTGSRGLRLGRFEAADGGTLFLDEIDSLPLAGQVKLLRALENGEFQRLGSSATRRADVRIVSATNADLKRAIAEGRFREDLYFRVNVVELAVPPLRERPEDIGALADYFLGELARARGAAPRALSPAARAALLAHPWPGNVRELKNRLQRADLLAAGETIGPEDLDLGGLAAAPAAPVPQKAPEAAPPETVFLETAADRAERAELERRLLVSAGNVSRVADDLGISRQALYRRMARLGIVIERRPGGAA
jgi:DNA-binding NtrC family response regulator